MIVILNWIILFCSHNDLPWQMRASYFNKIEYANASLKLPQAHLHTSIDRLRQGRVGAQVSRYIYMQTRLFALEL